MKYKLIIDKDAEEEIIAIVHAPSSLTQEIEDLVHSFLGADYIIGHHEEEIRKLPFGEIECITVIDRKVMHSIFPKESFRFSSSRCPIIKSAPEKLCTRSSISCVREEGA